jgi:hypothetical protein
MLGFLLAALGALPTARALPPLHPNSFSTSRLTVQGAAARLELRVQALSLIEVLPEGLDGDGVLSGAELEAGRGAVADYVARHYVLRAGSGGDRKQGAVLAGRLTDLSAEEADDEGNAWVNAAFEYRADALLPDLMIEVTLFIESAPDHRDACTLTWNGGEPVETLFWMGEFRRYYAPESPPVPTPLLGWVKMGMAHILGGWDHMAFLLALIVAAGTVGSLLGVITAFTLAHSITLALAALGVVHENARLVEVGITLSIIWVAVANLLAQRPHARWKEAFCFGLLHGLGFAGFLAEAFYGEPRRLLPLVGFNLGVEAGQLVVVLAVLLALAFLRAVARAASRAAAAAGELPKEPRWLAPRWVRLTASAAICVLAPWWFAVGAGWM